jgi:hypothetical protein
LEKGANKKREGVSPVSAVRGRLSGGGGLRAVGVPSPFLIGGTMKHEAKIRAMEKVTGTRKTTEPVSIELRLPGDTASIVYAFPGTKEYREHGPGLFRRTENGLQPYDGLNL